MLLKVSDGDGGWILFDKVDKVHTLGRDHIVNNIDELNALGGQGTLNLVSKECFQNNKEGVTVGIIEFEKENVVRTALFTNVVFVCNDAGDTLDRLSPRRKGGK